jgi:cytidyltransferase-like protein
MPKLLLIWSNMEYKRIVIATGGFDPIHSGHIELLKDARTYGDLLIVGLNSDDWLKRKKGVNFLPYDERASVLANLKPVDWVMSFDDIDDTACDCIKQVRDAFPKAEIVFVNGGDRDSMNIPEMKFCDFYDVKFVFGVGGSFKKNSSSWILQNWMDNVSKSGRTTRATRPCESGA